MLDEKDTRASRIVFQETKSEGQGSTADVSASGAVVGGTEHENGASGECF